jgi:AraC family transcriptional regulator
MNETVGRRSIGFSRETRARAERVAGLTLTEWTHATNHSMSRHSHDLGCIALTLDGCMVEQYDEVRFERPQGALLYRPPAEPHACTTSEYGARCFVMEFDMAMLPVEGRTARRLARPVLQQGGPLAKLAMRAYEEWRQKDDAHELMLHALMNEVVAGVARVEYSDSPRSVPPRWLRRVKEVLDDDVAEAPTLSMLAQVGEVHPMHLARAFRQHFHTSVGEYLRQRRIAVASDQLRNTNRALTEIALSAGFSSHSHFCTAFRRATGLTPGEFRRLRR